LLKGAIIFYPTIKSKGMKRTTLAALLMLGFFSSSIGATPGPSTEKADTTPTTIIANTSTERIHIYPNPSRGTFYFNGIRGDVIEVYDQLGQPVYNAEADSDRYPVSLPSRKAIYSYRIIDQGALVQQGKIVVVE
jgi:hypothetical protein